MNNQQKNDAVAECVMGWHIDANLIDWRDQNGDVAPGWFPVNSYSDCARMRRRIKDLDRDREFAETLAFSMAISYVDTYGDVHTDGNDFFTLLNASPNQQVDAALGIFGVPITKDMDRCPVCNSILVFDGLSYNGDETYDCPNKCEE